MTKSLFLVEGQIMKHQETTLVEIYGSGKVTVTRTVLLPVSKLQRGREFPIRARFFKSFYRYPITLCKCLKNNKVQTTRLKHLMKYRSYKNFVCTFDSQKNLALTRSQSSLSNRCYMTHMVSHRLLLPLGTLRRRWLGTIQQLVLFIAASSLSQIAEFVALWPNLVYLFSTRQKSIRTKLVKFGS